ncbi:hypothetical protein FITA111629_12515 [Filibacter tadaridae]|uniref:Uncharacterized protein n=1 Tax=Filibacter tadaridae TaxID=2483811 RepID=A0A3P5X2P9_9BACL|nr:hypothetical protein [Filibacter tadaridae]VDC25521.1 hypothetical protein FILTAD_01227 [Filibacter tadaridae]
MSKYEKDPMSAKKTDGVNQTKMQGKEYTTEERRSNEVASTEYSGGGKRRGGIEIDRLETGE